jgi:hypothetical protein
MKTWKVEIEGLEPVYVHAERMQQAVNQVTSRYTTQLVYAPCTVFIERKWRRVKAQQVETDCA